MSRPHILIVEDDVMVALDLEFIVLEHVDATTTVVSSVEGATRCLREPVDFAFLDIDVRDGKTYPLAEELSRIGIPFTFVSGSNPAKVPDVLRQHPFIAKPYMPAAITDAVKQHMVAAGR